MNQLTLFDKPKHRLIPLTQGKYAIVDAEDYERLNQYKWCAHKKRYGGYMAVRNVRKQTQPPRKMILMHRQIMGFPKGKDIDHINHIVNDNRRINLRICTRSQNMQNCKRFKNGSSSYKGVSWSKWAEKWEVNIKLNSKRFHLGRFDSEIEAAKAYDKKALELFGEFARINF